MQHNQNLEWCGILKVYIYTFSKVDKFKTMNATMKVYIYIYTFIYVYFYIYIHFIYVYFYICIYVYPKKLGGKMNSDIRRKRK